MADADSTMPIAAAKPICCRNEIGARISGSELSRLRMPGSKRTLSKSATSNIGTFAQHPAQQHRHPTGDHPDHRPGDQARHHRRTPQQRLPRTRRQPRQPRRVHPQRRVPEDLVTGRQEHPVQRPDHDKRQERARRSPPQHGGDPAQRRPDRQQRGHDRALRHHAQVVQSYARGGQRGERDQRRPGESEGTAGPAHRVAAEAAEAGAGAETGAGAVERTNFSSATNARTAVTAPPATRTQ